MGVLDDILEKAKTVATVVSNKTGEIYEVSKLKLQAVSLNAEIQKCYERLGRMKYDQERTQTDNTEIMEVCIAEITDLLEALDELNEMINDETGTMKCTSCSATIPLDSTYCAKCGMKISRDEAIVSTAVEADEPDEETLD